jgi:hypothetical protein
MVAKELVVSRGLKQVDTPHVLEVSDPWLKLRSVSFAWTASLPMNFVQSGV